jgi:ComF family protein
MIVTIWKPLLDFFLKPNCPLCDRPTPKTLCIYCDRQLQSEKLSDPLQDTIPFILAWGNYSSTLKRAIAQCKYHNQPQLGYYLGELLGQTWLAHLPHNSQIIAIPIPLHPDKQRQRGFNQAELIAKGFCHRTGIKLNQSLLRVKSTEAQFQLNPTDRQQNLSNAFALKSGHKLQGRSIILIDDIYTTGATIKAASQPLQNANANIVGIAVSAIARLN